MPTPEPNIDNQLMRMQLGAFEGALETTITRERSQLHEWLYSGYAAAHLSEITLFDRIMAFLKPQALVVRVLQRAAETVKNGEHWHLAYLREDVSDADT